MNRRELLIKISPDAMRHVVFTAVKGMAEQDGPDGQTHFSGSELAEMVDVFQAEVPAGTVKILNSPDLSIGFQTKELAEMEKPADLRRLLEDHRDNLNYLAGLI